MSTTIDDAHEEEYLEEQFLLEERENGVNEYKQQITYDLISKVELIHSNISISSISTNYKKQTIHSIEHGIWEYASVLVWKTTILFIYEKLYQLNKISKLHQDIKNVLESQNQDCLTPFSFSCVKDDTIVQKTGFLWRNVDQNFKNMFKSLLDERNSLSHVNRYPYTKNKFITYQEKANDFLDYIQNIHLVHIDELCHQILESEQSLYLSKKELLLLIDKYSENEKVLAYITSLIPDKLVSDDLIDEIIPTLITVFLNSPSFSSSYSNGRFLILPVTSLLSENDYLKLINTTNGQIIHSGEMEKIYLKLYQESINNFESAQKVWANFSKKIKEKNAQNNYKQLIELIDSE